MKQITSALENRTQAKGEMLLQEQEIKPPLANFHWHLTGFYQPSGVVASQVLVEYLWYDGSWFGRINELIERVQEIASFRAVSTSLVFSALTCVGFYHNLGNHFFGIMYNFPPRPVSPLSSMPPDRIGDGGKK